MACIMGFLAVGIGAYGAHGLKGFIQSEGLPPERIDIFKTGVSYHFYHTFAMFCAMVIPFAEDKWKRLAALLFFIGIILFSGSLYLLAVREYVFIPIKILGPATPIGGLFYMAGWATLFLGIWKGKTNNSIT